MATRNLAITNIQNGTSSGVRRSIQQTITTQEAWAAFWAEHGSTRFPAPKLPDVDFAQDMVIAVYLGERSSGGYSCNIVKVQEKAREIVVTYEAGSPSGFGTSSMTQPFHLVKVSASKKKISFVKQPKPDSDE